MKVAYYNISLYSAIMILLILVFPASGLSQVPGNYNISSIEELKPIGESHIAKRGWEITPMLGIEEIYSTNIFGRDDMEDMEEEDLISAAAAGLQLKLGSSNRYLVMKHIGVAYDYHENPRFNHQTYSGEMSFYMSTPGGFLFGVSERYEYRPSPPFSQYTYKRTYYDNEASANIGYKFSDVYTVQITYQNFIRGYIEDDFEDGDFLRNSWMFTGEYHFSPKTALMILYKFDTQSYDNVDDDFCRHTANAGLKWDVTGKLTGHLLAGYTQKDLRYSVAGRDDSYSTWSMDANLTERFSSYTTMTLQLSRSIETEENTLTTYSTNATEIITSGELAAKHFIWKQIFIAANIGAEDRQYKDEGYFKNSVGMLYNIKRDDTLLILGANAGYDNREWLRAGIGYEYRNNDSNIDIMSYTDNRILLQVNFSY
jgi:hypothetical protein